MKKNMVKRLICMSIITSFTGSSINLFVMGTSITLFDICLLLCITLSLIAEKPNKAKQTVSIQFLIISFFILLTIVNCVDLLQWIKGIILTIKIIVFIAIIVRYAECDADIRCYVKSYMMGLVLTVAVCIFEIVTGVHLFSNYANVYISDSWMYAELLKGPTAFLFNPNNVAVVIALGLPWVKYILPRKAEGSLLAQLAIHILLLYVIFKTGSRGGIIVGCLMTALTIYCEGKEKRRILKYYLILVSVLGVVVYYFQDYIIQQLNYASFFSTGTFALFISGDKGRLTSIVKALNVALNTFFVGCGPWCYEVYSDMIYGMADSVHMFFVELLACYGLFIFIVVVVVIVKAIKCEFRLAKRVPNSFPFFITLSGFIPLSIIPPTIFTLFTIWAAIGICFAHIVVNRDKGDIKLYDTQNNSSGLVWRKRVP